MSIPTLSVVRPPVRFGNLPNQQQIQQSMAKRREVFAYLENNVQNSMEKLTRNNFSDSSYNSGSIAASGIVNAYTRMAQYMLPPEVHFPQ